MRRSFANQVAVVTGASSGLGQALAKALAADGCKVALVARRREELEALADEIGAAGGVAVAAAADVAEREQMQRAVKEVRGRLGPVDLLIASAGIGAPTLLEPMNVSAQERLFRVNLFGVIHAVEAVLPDMLQRGGGHLAAVSSLAGYKGLPGQSAYSASKAALNTYLEGLRIQLRGRGIAVTTLCPGFVRTPMTASHPFRMPWLLEADDAARRMLGALRRRAKVYDFPWQTTLLMKLTRWFPDWLMARGMRNYDTRRPEPMPAP